MVQVLQMQDKQIFSCRRQDDKKPQCKTSTSPEEQKSLRYIFVTSFLLIVITSYLYPYLFQRPNQRHSKMMASRSSRYSNFAGAISEKLESDRYWLEGDKSHWYNVESIQVENASKLVGTAPNQIMAKFVQLGPDEETGRFIRQSVEITDQLFTQMWHNLAKSVLKRFFGYTQTDINGYLRRGSMFVLSSEQFSLLREKAGIRSCIEAAEGSLIDLGAGDGKPTDYLRPFYKETYATEASWAMRDILKEKGITVLDIDGWDVQDDSQRTFDAVACLNLFDRCEKPLTILRQIRKALKPGGLLVIALVLPFSPYVEWNTDHRPLEYLLNPSQENPNEEFSFEKQIPLIINKIESEGFSIGAWSRVPYLCEGDMGQSLYVLSDAVFLCTLNDQ